MRSLIKGEIVFVRIMVPMMIGIILAFCCKIPVILLAISKIVSVGLLILLWLYIASYKRLAYRWRWLPGLMFSLLMFTTGYILTATKHYKNEPRHFSKQKYEFLLVTIKSEPRFSSGILRFEALVSEGLNGNKHTNVSGDLLVAMQTDGPQTYKYGDRLLIPANFNEVEEKKNPAEFDYKAYLAAHGLYHQVFLNRGQVLLIDRNRGNSIIAFALELRQRMVVKFNKYLIDKDAAAVASTLILGYRADLSKEVVDAYQKTGTMHVLSVSGMHVAIVYMVMVFLLRFMERGQKLRLARAILMIVLIWFYALITGFSPSVCRSAMMISFVILGKAIYRSQNTYNLLASSATLLLVYDPYFLFDVGFQLSYLAVVGLVFLYPKIYHILYIKSKIGDEIWSCLALSLAAQLATSPLSIYYFHQFPVYFLVSNIFILIPVAFIMYAGLLFLFVPWDFLLKPLGWLLNYSIVFTNKGLYYIENLPQANIAGLWFSFSSCILLSILIVTITLAFTMRNKPLLFISLAIILIVVADISMYNIRQFNNKSIVFYSLRKNKAIGFFDERSAILISDLNPDEKIFGYSVQPSLDSALITKRIILAPKEQFIAKNFYADSNFIRFRDKTILRWNKDFDRKKFDKKIEVDILLLQDGPRISIAGLKPFVDFETLIADGSNSFYTINKWQKEADSMGIKLHVTKNNPAYILHL